MYTSTFFVYLSHQSSEILSVCLIDMYVVFCLTSADNSSPSYLLSIVRSSKMSLFNLDEENIELKKKDNFYLLIEEINRM